MKRSVVLLLVVVFPGVLFSQKDVTNFGLQIKPIIPSNYLNTGTVNTTRDGIGFTIEPQTGYSFGMVIRQGYTDQISLEFGINYTKRNYDLIIEDEKNSFRGKSDFSYIIYEFPIQGLVYIRLSEELFMNVAMGGALDILPTNWKSSDYYFGHLSHKTSWIVPALLANVGFEYRTRKDGYFYLGASFHRPFKDITRADVKYIQYEHQDKNTIVGMYMNGNYLTIDFRYFFHENAQRR